MQTIKKLFSRAGVAATVATASVAPAFASGGGGLSLPALDTSSLSTVQTYVIAGFTAVFAIKVAIPAVRYGYRTLMGFVGR